MPSVMPWSLETQSTWHPSGRDQQVVLSWRKTAAADRLHCRRDATQSTRYHLETHLAVLRLQFDWHTALVVQCLRRHTPATWTTDCQKEEEHGEFSWHLQSHLAVMQNCWMTDWEISTSHICRCQKAEFSVDCETKSMMSGTENSRRNLPGETVVRCCWNQDWKWDVHDRWMNPAGSLRAPG